MTDQSDAGNVGIFPRRTNRIQEARVYSHDGPIGRRKRGYITVFWAGRTPSSLSPPNMYSRGGQALRGSSIGPPPSASPSRRRHASSADSSRAWSISMPSNTISCLRVQGFLRVIWNLFRPLLKDPGRPPKGPLLKDP
eukprot:165671-Prorocentrum_minimum.AAC.1